MADTDKSKLAQKVNQVEPQAIRQPTELISVDPHCFWRRPFLGRDKLKSWSQTFPRPAESRQISAIYFLRKANCDAFFIPLTKPCIDGSSL
jgi:hypothetical protein